MGTWTSLVVLSLAVVSTLSFPRPDAEYKIPTVGLGARAQYYVLHSDGTYKFGYDTADGIYEQAMAQAPGDVAGAFGYKDPTGADIKLEYTADDRGFLPTGAHLPVAPQADFGARTPGGSAAAPVIITKSAPTTYGVPAPSAAAALGPATPVEVAQVRSSAGDDGSYSFSYDTASSSRSESADARNSVTGRYSFVADDGVNRRIDYVAAADTGYIAEGDSLPVGPPVPGAESGIPTGRILPVLSEEEANALAAATSASGPVSYSAPSSAPGASPGTFPASVTGGDASYSFSYDAGDSARSESADADLNVEGTYSFVPPETSHRLSVHYRAGADTGFVATGDHLPVAPDADFGARTPGGSAAAPVVITKAAPTTYGVSVPSAAAAPGPATPVEVAQVRSSAGDDGSYSFSYDTASSSRSESADARNSVTGRYSFVADDGVNRRIDYVAGADTGYIAEGDSLPVGPPVPGAESGIPTGRILPVLSEEEANALAAATSASGPVSYSAPSSAPGASPGTFPASGTGGDASYSFSYDAGDSARSESADADLNVEGTYSFVPPETSHRLSVHYRAGADTGFVATGDHLPVAPEADFGARTPGGSAAAPVLITKAAPTTYGVSVTSASAAPAPPAAPGPATPVEVAQVRSSAGDDGGYSFSYDTASSSRSESADARNSVTGRYSFVADDGVNRRIDYVAGADTGYIAEGDSLPVGPPVPGAESGIPTGRILPVLSEEEANALAAATSASGPVSYSAPSSAPGASPGTFPASGTSGDASYSFSYDAGDSARSESADADLNVEGTYSFVPPETSHRLSVHYRAGADTGFVATGDHLPVAPDADFGTRTPGGSAAAPVVITKAAPTTYGVSVPSTAAAPGPATPVEVAQVRSSAGDDGSYSFSYDTASSSRSESADARNSVTGRYSFVADDGVNRRIDYVAGADTGYIAEGDSLPVGPPVPGAESGIPTGRIVPVFSEEEANALAATGSAVAYIAPTAPGVATAADTGTPGLPSSSAHGDAAAAVTSYSAPTSATQGVTSSSGHTSHVVGDVLVHQYSPTNALKYGYSFSAVRR